LMKATSPASPSGHSNGDSIAKSNAVIYESRAKIPLPCWGLGSGAREPYSKTTLASKLWTICS
jgi:hypothetical protein